MSDETGLCLGVRGIAKPESAAFITSIAKMASHLHQIEDNKIEYPTINIEYENNQVIIRNEGTFTLAVFM